MNLSKKVTNIFDRTIDLLAILGVVFLIFIMVSVLYEVGMRHFLGRASIWVIELTAYSLLFITFLGTAWVLRREEHVRVELVLNQLSPRAQGTVNVITSILSAIVCLVIAWYSTKASWEAFQIGYTSPTELEFPRWILLSVIPVGSFLLSIQFLRRTYRYLRNRRTS